MARLREWIVIRQGSLKVEEYLHPRDKLTVQTVKALWRVRRQVRQVHLNLSQIPPNDDDNVTTVMAHFLAHCSLCSMIVLSGQTTTAILARLLDTAHNLRQLRRLEFHSVVLTLRSTD